jgi:hypothetical protein
MSNKLLRPSRSLAPILPNLYGCVDGENERLDDAEAAVGQTVRLIRDSYS